MTIDFKQPLNDLDGVPITEARAGADGQPAVFVVTLGRAAVNALMAVLPEDQTKSGEDKLKAFLLAEKVNNAVVALSVEEIALLKARIAKGYGPLIVGRAWRLLDPVQ